MLDVLADKFEEGRPLYAGWMSTASPIIAETFAGIGWDAVVIDMQHAALSSTDMAQVVSALTGKTVPALVRVRQDDVGLATLALDQGAHGVIFPMVDTGAQGRLLASHTKYAPEGTRSWGPQRALPLSQLDKETYLARANDATFTFAMIETRTALQHIDAILSVEGFDGLFLGPNDLAVSLSGGQTAETSSDIILQAAEQLLKKAEAHQLKAGVFANTVELAEIYRDMGYDLIAIGSDLSHIKTASLDALRRVRG